MRIIYKGILFEVSPKGFRLVGGSMTYYEFEDLAAIVTSILGKSI